MPHLAGIVLCWAELPFGLLKREIMLASLNAINLASAEALNSVIDDGQSVASLGDVQIWPDTASEDDDYDDGSDLCCRGSWNAGIFAAGDSAAWKELLVNVASGSATQGADSEGVEKLSRSLSDISQSTVWNTDSSYASVVTTEDSACHNGDLNSNKNSNVAIDVSSEAVIAESTNIANACDDSEDTFSSMDSLVQDDEVEYGMRSKIADPASPLDASETNSCFDSSVEDHPCSLRGTATTLMVRNLPETVTQGRFIEELRRTGFDNLFDFCYVPTRSFKYHQGVGFAFVNFVNPSAAKVFMNRWHKSRRFSMRSGASWLNVSRARVQGRDANMTEAGSSRMLRIRNRNFKPFCVDLSDEDPAEVEKALCELMKPKYNETDGQYFDERDDEESSWKPVGADREQKSKPWRSETTGQRQRSYDTNYSRRSDVRHNRREDAPKRVSEQNRDGRVKMPSIGSAGHPWSCKSYCKYAHKPSGCKYGFMCDRCHLCQDRQAGAF